MGNPLPVALPSEARKAQKIVRDFTNPDRVDQVIPASVLHKAKGFAIFSVFRIGFLMSARGGAGVVVARLPDGTWSPPAAIGLGGLGGGFNAGAEVTDFLIVLTSRRAVSTFMSTGSLQLGGNMALALGPLGRAAEAGGSVSSSGKLAALLSYSKSKGLYGGISLEGTILMDRSDANAKAYGAGVTSKQILAGQVESPDFAANLTDTLNRISGRAGAESAGFFDEDSSVVSPTTSYGNAGYGGAGYGGAGYGGAGYGGAARRSTRDPFGDSDSDLQSQPSRDPYAAENRAHRRGLSDSKTRGGGGGHWSNAYSGESRALNERHRLDDMDDFDRELQQDPSGPSHRRGGSNGAPRRAAPGVRDGSAWADKYNFGGIPPSKSTSSRARPSYGLDGSDDDLPSSRSRPVGDYEANLSPNRALGTQRTGTGGFTGNSVGNRPTSPIEADSRSLRARSASATTGSSKVGEESLVMAKFAYQPESSGDTDISFAAGDVIHVTKRTATRDDWWAGECHGKVGYFPANYTVDL